jgi:hypothetical protein
VRRSIATRPPSLRARAIGAAAAVVLAVGALLTGACEDQGAFTTAEGESYCGAITLGRAFREGLGPRVQMRLVLDADRLDGATSPGRVWAWEPETEVAPGADLLSGVPLEPIAPLAHDALGDLDFGEGHERNAVYALRPSDPAAEGMLAILSLRSDGRVELRLLRAGIRGEGAPPERAPLFGVFLLERRRGDCG